MKKKIFSILLIAVLVLSSFATVFADDEPTGITLTNGKAGHTYTVYQIFTGAAEGKQLNNIQWGDGVTDTFKATKATAAAFAEEMVGKDARKIAQDLVAAKALTNGKAVTLDADGPVVFENLAPGYYVVLDSNGNEEAVEGDFSSEIIVEVVEPVAITLKGSPTTSEKKVLDNADKDVNLDVSNLKNVDGDWQDSADHDFGDEVPFMLTATLADNVAAYAKYHVEFKDTQDTGLSPVNAWYVNVLGKDFNVSTEEGKTTATATTDNGTVITVTVKSAKDANPFIIRVDLEQENPTTATIDDKEVITSNLNSECNSESIVVKYTAVLNEGAVIGEDGNENTLVCTYSNNPEDRTGNEEGKTKEDKNKVFTYKVEVDKVDETGAALDGAGFTLYKQVAAGTEGAQTGKAIKEALAAKNSKIVATDLEDDANYVVVDEITDAEAGSNFEFKGIDDGTYVLVETEIPAGYNALESYKFDVNATHSDEADEPVLLTFTTTAPFTASKASGEITTAKGNKHTADSGEVYAEIENNSGAVLPETGGMGTTIIYILGAALVIGAGVVLVSRKRSNDR